MPGCASDPAESNDVLPLVGGVSRDPGRRRERATVKLMRCLKCVQHRSYATRRHVAQSLTRRDTDRGPGSQVPEPRTEDPVDQVCYSYRPAWFLNASPARRKFHVAAMIDRRVVSPNSFRFVCSRQDLLRNKGLFQPTLSVSGQSLKP